PGHPGQPPRTDRRPLRPADHVRGGRPGQRHHHRAPRMTVTRSALVTGGSRGIGAEAATRLAAEGYHLTNAARTAETLEQTAERLRAEQGVEVQPVVARMNDLDEVRALAAAQGDRFGGLNALVLSAGTGTAGAVADMPAKTYERMLDVNFRAPITLVQAAIPLLRKSAAEDAA